ncbi:MAG: glycosyltransferase [Candidatus Omnitrophica bacterium]|nr:glycosyltransferase [Candidatus Omnitrophota bacterium]
MMNKSALSLSVIVPVYNERYLVAFSLKRLLELKSEFISSMQVIIVDDCSRDGSYAVLESFAKQDARIVLTRHEKNRGKGAAIRTGLALATGDVTIIHDADLEYNPEDIAPLMRVFIEEGADAVMGTRYLSSQSRRVLMYRHSLINKGLTAMVNCLTDLDLTDAETCYKAIKTDLFKSIPIRCDDFGFEIEILMKLARRRANIFEVPIRYQARTYEEGKKIRVKDGLWAFVTAMRFFFVEDIYHRDSHGLHILMDMNNARRFNKWMADQLRPHLGDRVLEIGAGIGNLTKQFIPRQHYAVTDIDARSLHYMKSFALGRPFMEVRHLDADKAEDFKGLEQSFDTVLIVNVLEHVADEQATLKNIYGALQPGGKIVVLVPQFPALYGSFDKVLGHRERYTEKKLRDGLAKAGFEVSRMFEFNKLTVLSWYLNGKILKRKRFSRFQLKILELLVPLLTHVDRYLPWGGLSLIAVGVKK